MEKVREMLIRTISLVLAMMMIMLSTSTFLYASTQGMEYSAEEIQKSISNETNIQKLNEEKSGTEELIDGQDEIGDIDSNETPKNSDLGEDSSEDKLDAQENSIDELKENPFEEEEDKDQPKSTAEGDTEEDKGRFKIALRWDGADDTNINWHAEKNEDRVIKLTFYYQNEVTPRRYEAGSLKVTIPGIGGLNRSGAIRAIDIAADATGATEIKRDWSYSYNQSTDTYTFTNNHDIEEGESFNGSFQMLWKFNSRACINGFNKDIKATLNDGKEQIESKEIDLEFTSVEDEYKIEKTAKSITSADGLSKYVENGKSVSDYAWVQYTFKYYPVEPLKSRALESAYIIDTFPEGCVIAKDTNDTKDVISDCQANRHSS